MKTNKRHLKELLKSLKKTAKRGYKLTSWNSWYDYETGHYEMTIRFKG